MKYSGIVCTGHPRSGTHYIAALISINFLGDEDYLKVYRNHELPEIVQDPNIAYFHIWRDFEGMARSIYVLRERFGLAAGSYEEFLESRYSDMWGIEQTEGVVTNVRTLNGSARLSGISDFFRGVDMNPREYWEYYNINWINCAKEKTNIIRVKYDDMLKDFNRTMLHIEMNLHSSVDEFRNIDKKVGWWK